MDFPDEMDSSGLYGCPGWLKEVANEPDFKKWLASFTDDRTSPGWKHQRKQELSQVLMSRLPRPHLFTLVDVWEVLVPGILLDLDEGNVEKRLGSFLWNMSEYVEGPSYRETKILLAEVDDGFNFGENSQWDAPHFNISVDCLKRIVWEGRGEPRAKRFLYGKLYGQFSERAAKKMAAELESVLQPVLLAVADLERPEHAKPRPRLAILHNSELTKYDGFISALLGAYCKPEERRDRDTFDRRIRNAVLLIVEAHRQRNGALALALYCTAIEALLTRKGVQGDISSALADHVATLLEPKPQRRPDAVDFVKDLYNVRSRVLHGERIASEDHEIRNPRCLVCALLYTVLSRQEFVQQTGFPVEKPEDFLNELRKCRFNPGHPMGGGPVNVVQLWRKKGQQQQSPPE